MTLFDTSFDLVFSIGSNCACAMLLDRNGFRMRSLPFDWIAEASFGQRIDSLCFRFSDFLLKENLRWYSDGIGDKSHVIYADAVTGYRFVHDFAANQPFDVTYPAVRAKYDRRIARLLADLDQGISACLVWWSDVAHPSDDECVAGIERLRQAFPTSDCRLLVFENDRVAVRGRIDIRKLSRYCVKAVGCFAPEGSGLQGDKRMTDRVLRQLRKGSRLAAERRSFVFRRLLIHLLSFWHFSPPERRRAREQWKTRLIRKGK